MPPDRVLPGLVTPAAAELLTDRAAQTEENRRAIEQMVEEWIDEFPAALTGYSDTYGTCSWYEEDYDSAGQRVEKRGGWTGTFTSWPAYPVGNGLMPPPGVTGSGSAGGWPIQVRLTRRLVASTGDAAGTPVFEFPWFCGCDDGAGS